VTSTAKIWFGRGIFMLHSKYGQSSLPNAGFVGRGGRGAILSSVSRIGEMPPVDVAPLGGRRPCNIPEATDANSTFNGSRRLRSRGRLDSRARQIATATVLIFKNSACRVSSER
jgi:hypothetical protein